jgi:hypothetical protein
MKKYKFEIELTEEDIKGDEFFEQCLEADGTGIKVLSETIADIIRDSNLMISSIRDPKDVIKLITYTDD